MSPVGTLPPVAYGSRGSRHRSRPLRHPPPRRAPHPPPRASSHRRSAPSTHAPLGRRIGIFRVLLVMLLLAVVARLADIQVVHSSHYKRLAADELSVTVADPGLRGDVYDRNGAVLAISVPTKTVVADDFQIAKPADEARALSPIIKVPVEKLTSLLSEHSGYVPIATEVPASQGNKLASDNLPGITLFDTSERIDPDGSLAGPLLGQVHSSGAGASGLEYQYNGLLSGKAGTQTLLESPAGVDLPQGSALTRSAGDNGTGIELTIDQPLQYVTENALGAQIAATGAESGTAIVMDTRTGDILAMANLVKGNNGLGLVSGTSSPVSEAPSNLGLTQAYEPGSVFKLVTFSAALQDGIINPNTSFTVPDQIELDGSTFHDAEFHPTEELTATQILAQSSNIGTSEIARDLGEDRLLAQVRNLGFGQVTGLDFPGENPGVLAGAAQWEPTNLVSLPIGQVDAVTAIQVLDAYNAVANGGLLVQPRLVRATIGADGKATATKASATRRVFAPSIDAELTAMLESVVAAGTGVSAAIPGYTVMGKTGTAQVPVPGADAYISGDFVASFVGAAPASNPVLTTIVVLNHPTPIYGGTVAAPVFSQIMSYALHRYGIPTTPGAPSQAPATAPAAGDQAQDVT
jgi:cell division protein FtsI (penicillin-binding protein 3)